MASARKPFTPSKTTVSERDAYKEFLTALLAGTVVASALVDTKDIKGKIKIDYDDPNG